MTQAVKVGKEHVVIKLSSVSYNSSTGDESEHLYMYTEQF